MSHAQFSFADIDCQSSSSSAWPELRRVVSSEFDVCLLECLIQSFLYSSIGVLLGVSKDWKEVVCSILSCVSASMTIEEAVEARWGAFGAPKICHGPADVLALPSSSAGTDERPVFSSFTL
eukprot:CAMPEP_0198734468 /NCGR_PEP_ID=MMETSP1475-20131203/52763_1 /TAXON_ID= ORGANISM="Unidentified sp., Strain CCMP1999" /NCGR_SAMPLE_ID=MMETSP1475 /ASSEMBLY_ACC=CAM_ASM_001111 /LENGTH=120 /DNA_ID=CAMNT_0044497947 /DNA_START=939 /DNA_END=1301 /DNA_ORIENTATION=+